MTTMNMWEVFVNNVAELREDQELVLSIRTLNPGIYKYSYKRVRARVAADPERYPDRLQIRFGRGQLYQNVYSIEVVAEERVLPEKYAPRLVSREM